MSRQLTKTEKEQLLGFLEDLSEIFSNAGCNDFVLENTSANKTLIENVINYNFDGEDVKEHIDDLNASGTEIYTMDWLVLNYLKACVSQLPTTKDPIKKASKAKPEKITKRSCACGDPVAGNDLRCGGNNCLNSA